MNRSWSGLNAIRRAPAVPVLGIRATTDRIPGRVLSAVHTTKNYTNLSHWLLQQIGLDKKDILRSAAKGENRSLGFRARVNIDYHVAFDANLYSFPYNLVQELVEIRSTPTTVEILHKGTRIASHLRCRGRGQVITNEEHRPKSHRAHLEWTPSRMAHWAETIGPHTGRLFQRIMNDKPHPEMGYRGCLGIIRLAEKYSVRRVEAAAELALLTGACRYKSMESILRNSLDRMPPSSPPPASTPTHDNIRGSEYFE